MRWVFTKTTPFSGDLKAAGGFREELHVLSHYHQDLLLPQKLHLLRPASPLLRSVRTAQIQSLYCLLSSFLQCFNLIPPRPPTDSLLIFFLYWECSLIDPLFISFWSFWFLFELFHRFKHVIVSIQIQTFTTVMRIVLSSFLILMILLTSLIKLCTYSICYIYFLIYWASKYLVLWYNIPLSFFCLLFIYHGVYKQFWIQEEDDHPSIGGLGYHNLYLLISIVNYQSP